MVQVMILFLGGGGGGRCLSPPRLNIFTVGNMGVMICLGQGGLCSLSASSCKAASTFFKAKLQTSHIIPQSFVKIHCVQEILSRARSDSNNENKKYKDPIVHFIFHATIFSVQPDKTITLYMLVIHTQPYCVLTVLLVVDHLLNFLQTSST